MTVYRFYRVWYDAELRDHWTLFGRFSVVDNVIKYLEDFNDIDPEGVFPEGPIDRFRARRLHHVLTGGSNALRLRIEQGQQTPLEGPQ